MIWLALPAGIARPGGAIIMGDQTLSLPLQRIISAKMDITPIREKLLARNAKVGDIVAEFWACQQHN
jgi:hypothetical protein